MTRRYWWQNNNNTEREITMGYEWAGHTPPVRPVPGIGETDHNDFVAAEHARADEIRKRDREQYGRALVRFTERVKALPELGGLLGSDTQFSELTVIEAMLTEVMTRKAVLQARARSSVGLYQQMTGKPLPPYEGGLYVPGEECQPEHRDYQGAGMCREETCPAYGQVPHQPEDESCDNGEDAGK